MPHFDAECIHLHHRISELHCVPHLDIAAATVQRADRDSDSNVSAIWLFPLDGSEAPRPMTAGTATDQTPRWSPDGTQLAFISSRGGSPQVHLMPRQGGEARALTRLPEGVSTLAWRPDGRALLVIAPVPVDPDDRGARPAAAVERPAHAPRLAWRLPYKQDGRGYALDRELHVFTVDPRTGEATRVTDGCFDVNAAVWSPDGQRIAYARQRDGRRAHLLDLWVADADGGNARQLTHEQATALAPSWSPDGKRIVFTGSLEAGDQQMRLWCVEMDSGRVHGLGPEDLEVVATDEIRWSDDSARVLLVLARHGVHEVATVGVPDGRVQRLVTGDWQIKSLSCTARRLVYCTVAPDQPDTVCASDWQGEGERPLGDLNAWFAQRVALQVERRSFEVPDGDGGTERIEGWLVRERGAQGPQPLLVDVHGGPAAYALVSFTDRPYWPVLCARGWTVLALNPAGSTSYGREFAARLNGRWGDLDLPQHVAAVEALRREGLADERVAMAGKSYGGYMGAWAIGQCTLFRAVVVISPVGNLETHYGTSDNGYYFDPYAMNGEHFLSREAAKRLSPMNHVEKARTPTLFLQGEDDERCPKCQSEELFVTMVQASDTPTEMVIYPGADHHFMEYGRPSHRIDLIRRTVDWLERWVSVPVPPHPSAEDPPPGG